MDISHVLLHGSEKGHETLFHPNSGMEGAVMVSDTDLLFFSQYFLHCSNIGVLCAFAMILACRAS